MPIDPFIDLENKGGYLRCVTCLEMGAKHVSYAFHLTPCLLWNSASNLNSALILALNLNLAFNLALKLNLALNLNWALNLALNSNSALNWALNIDNFLGFQRAVSCSIALNDGFEGGEFAFFNGEVSYKQAKGSMLLFPSSFQYPHQVNPVTSGTRYSIVTWFN